MKLHVSALIPFSAMDGRTNPQPFCSGSDLLSLSFFSCNDYVKEAVLGP